MLARAAGALGVGGADIQLESDEFNRWFRVIAADRRIAFDVLHPRVMQLLLDALPVHWRLDGDAIVSWEQGGLDPQVAWARARLL